jgi:putative ABC transport system permease protein
MEQDLAATVKIAMAREGFAAKYLKRVGPLRQCVTVEEMIPGVMRIKPADNWQIIEALLT